MHCAVSLLSFGAILWMALSSLSVYLVLSHRINHHHTQTHRAQQVSPFERRDVPMATANTLTMIINYCSSLPGVLSAGEKEPACIKNSN